MQRELRRRLLLSFHSIAGDKNREQVATEKTKPQNKTQFSKIKAHLKLRSKSVSQRRGGLEGSVRPSQLRAGYPPKKKNTKEKNCKRKNKSSRETKPVQVTRTSSKNREHVLSQRQ
jgi:hypothetical protein